MKRFWLPTHFILSSSSFSVRGCLHHSSPSSTALAFSHSSNNRYNSRSSFSSIIANKVLTTTSSTASRSFTSRIMASASSQDEQQQQKEEQQTTKAKELVVDPFCFRQFAEVEASKSYTGSVFNIPIKKFEEIVNSRYDPSNLKPGYAPFCKHIFLVNDFTDARLNVLPITKENEHCLRTKYEARSEKELPVLTRFFIRDLLLETSSSVAGGDGNVVEDVFPVAKYLDLILYSREQIEKENAAMGKESQSGGGGEGGKKETAPWGIVSIKAQDVDYELPMTPMTAMRNALGKDEGGSGVPLDKEAYMAAYNYWKDHATVA